MNISLIAAIGKNNELGKNRKLIWNLPNDLKYFKETTINHIIVMGRITFESLPCVLPKRKNIVISTKTLENDKIEQYKSIRDFLLEYEKYEDEIFVIGGASIYKQFINIATKMYLTEIDEVDEYADVYFPNFNKEEWYKQILLNGEDNNIKYNHVLYKRKTFNN